MKMIIEVNKFVMARHFGSLSVALRYYSLRKNYLFGYSIVRSQAKDSRKAMVEQSEFDEELSE
jgi:hypothetical protein